MKRRKKIKLCECECGELVKPGRRFVLHHHRRGAPSWNRGLTKDTSGVMRGISEKLMGHSVSEESKRKTSIGNRVKKPWMVENKNALGAIRTEETRKKLSKALMGHSVSKETRIAVSEAQTGNTHRRGKKASKETLNKMRLANLGKVHSEESKRKTSTTLKKQIEEGQRVGPNHYNWQGGISAEPYCFAWNSKEFKDFIKERDNCKYQNSECKGECNILIIHHIDYDKKNCSLDNLVTLCLSCNSRANFDREYWQGVFNILLKEAA